ncbi:MAG: hypothetical protein EOP14_07055, partial [Pseudomonas sp.]
MQSNSRSWLIATGLAGTLLLVFGFQNCAPMLPLEGVATSSGSVRATATPGTVGTPNPGTGGYEGRVIDGICTDDTTIEPMASRFVRSAGGTLLGFTIRDATLGVDKVAIWKVSGGNTIHGVVCWITGPDTVDKQWSLAAIGDFNGDFNQDLIWRNTNGQIAIWIMNGANRTQTQILNAPGTTTPITIAPSVWNIEGVGYFDGTGKQSLLWRDTAGNIKVWAMNGVNSPTERILTGGASIDNSYKIAGLGDFDGNFRADIVFRSGGSSTVWATEKGTTVGEDGKSVTVKSFAPAIATALAADIELKVIGDFNGDSKTDLLLQHSTAKNMQVRYQNDMAQLVVPLEITAPAEGWILQFAQDVTTDNISDWIWLIPGPSEQYLAYTPMSGSPGQTRTLGLVKAGWTLFN